MFTSMFFHLYSASQFFSIQVLKESKKAVLSLNKTKQKDYYKNKTLAEPRYSWCDLFFYVWCSYCAREQVTNRRKQVVQSGPISPIGAARNRSTPGVQFSGALPPPKAPLNPQSPETPAVH